MCRGRVWREFRTRRVRRIASTCLSLALVVGIAGANGWQPLSEDGLHDPDVAGVELLQQPSEALSVLPPDGAGNKVDWVEALRGGHIEPRDTLDDGIASEVLDLDVIMRGGGSLPDVRFPHEPHTRWLACENCHDELFEREAGTTPVSMLAILQGEYCGRCHGAVSFPLTECSRCHSVDPDSVTARTR